MDNVIDVKNLTKKYYLFDKDYKKMKWIFSSKGYSNVKIALDDVSFSAMKGEVVGIIGQNGAGKSTLMNIIAGITFPTSGDVDVSGTVGSLINLSAGFNNNFTGRENIYYKCNVMGVEKDEVDEIIDEIIEFTDIEEYFDLPLKMYSSGMKARLGFAIVAFLDPDILIMDEVFAVGDKNFKEKSKEKTTKMLKSGKTVLLSSHSDKTIRDFCSRVIYIRNNKIAFDGDVNKGLELYNSDQENRRKNSERRKDILNRRNEKIKRCFFFARNVIVSIGDEILKECEAKLDSNIESISEVNLFEEVDKKAIDYITSTLKKRFHRISIISRGEFEDTSRYSNDWVWVIDPLDITKGSSDDGINFNVKIALTYKGEPVLGLVYEPMKKTLFYARKEKGAYVEVDGVKLKLNVLDKLENLIIIESEIYPSGKMEKLFKNDDERISEFISVSDNYSGIMVAQGLADVYLCYCETYEWDTCAIQCIVQEAGGTVRRMDNTSMTYNEENCLNQVGYYIINRIENIQA